MTNWIKTSERMPTEKDASVEYSEVIVCTDKGVGSASLDILLLDQDAFPMWHPWPDPPEEEAGDCLWCGEAYELNYSHTLVGRGKRCLFRCVNNKCNVRPSSGWYDSEAEAIAASRKRHQC